MKHTPAHEQVYRELRRRILFGDLMPGVAVTLQGIADELGVSLTPVREAVRRLISERALELHGNRRISVPHLDETRLEEIYTARRIIELELVGRAVAGLQAAEIDRLASIDAEIDRSISLGDTRNYLRANFAFHFGIYAASGSTVMVPIAESLWLQLGPCLRVACGRFGTSNLADQHKRVLAGLRDRNVEDVIAAMRADIEQGHDFVREELFESQTARI